MNIPEFYQQLLSAPGVATLSVRSRDGSIQSTLVWTDFNGGFIKISMLAGSPKESSIRREKTATLLRSDPTNENMYISLRCELHEIRQTGAIEHLDMILPVGAENDIVFGVHDNVDFCAPREYNCPVEAQVGRDGH